MTLLERCPPRELGEKRVDEGHLHLLLPIGRCKRFLCQGSFEGRACISEGEGIGTRVSVVVGHDTLRDGKDLRGCRRGVRARFGKDIDIVDFETAVARSQLNVWNKDFMDVDEDEPDGVTRLPWAPTGTSPSTQGLVVYFPVLREDTL